MKWGAARQGERIDFNPYIFTGIPELSQGAGAFITSPFQLFTDISEAIDWSTWLRLAVAGLLMYAFLIVLGIKREAAILGGIIWAFNLHQMVWLEFPQHLATQLWMPALFCFNYIMLRRGPSWEAALGVLVINAFFFTSDYLQIVLYTYVAIGLFNTVYLVTDLQHPFKTRVFRWLAVHSVFVVSAVLLLPEAMVEMQLVAESIRSQQPWRVPEDVDWNLWTLVMTVKNVLPDIADFKRLFSPNFFGGLWGERYWGNQYFGNMVLGSAYCGIAAFLLAPLCLLWLKQPARRPLILASLVVLLFSFGMIHRDPALIKLFNVIPLGGVGGYPRYITIVTMFISVLAAVGLHVLMRLQPAVALKRFWIVFAAVLVSPIAIRVVDPGITLSNMSYPLALLAAIGLVAAVLCYVQRWQHFAVFLIIATVIDLGIVTYGFNPRMEDDRNFVTTPTLERLMADEDEYRVAQVSRSELYPPNLLQYYGIPSIGGYLTVAPYRYTRFVQATIDDYHLTTNGQLFFFSPNLEIFRLLNVKYVLSQDRIDDARVELVREAPGYQVYKLADPLPRVYCASRLLTFESELSLLDGFKRIAAQYDRPLALVKDTEESMPLTSECKVSDIRTRLNGVSFTVESDQPSYVLAPYNFSQNWTAESDDGRIEVIEANYNFVAMPVERGTSRVDLVYLDERNLVFSYLMIGLGAFVVGWFAVSRRRTPTGGLLAFGATVLVLYSLLELPFIANTELPERPGPGVVSSSDG